jgi:RNA polymerase sigma factor (sigma-70 family)
MEKLTDFIKREKGKLLHYIRKNINEDQINDAEDILQDVLLKIIQIDISESVENIASYVYRSIKNRIIDIYRKKDDDVSLNSGGKAAGNISSEDDGQTLENILHDAKYDVMDDLRKKEIIERIYKALEKLDPIYRDIFIATELEDMSFAEVSEMWNEPVGTLLSRKHRALGFLQNELKDLVGS